MWNKTEHNFHTAVEGTELTTTFEYQGNKTILGIQPNCNCTRFVLDNNILTVHWKTAIKYKEREALTFLTVEYTDGSIDDLTLTCSLSRKT